MTYTHFSSGAADYLLVYANHLFRIDSGVFSDENIKSLDAIVLEDGGCGPRSLEGKQLGISFIEPFYESIVKSAHKAKKPIYLIDVSPETDVFNTVAAHVLFVLPGLIGASLAINATKDIRKWPEEKRTRRDFLRTGLKGAAGAWLLSGYLGTLMSSVTDGESPEAMETIAATSQRIPPNPFIEFRNAVSAKKIEQFVVPLAGYGLGRKPKIAMVYGAAHTGVEGCIQHKWWRDAVLGFYEKANYCNIKKKDLNRVDEVLPVDDKGDLSLFNLGWKINSYDCHLF